MNISGIESAQAPEEKQGKNRYETGLDVREAASMLDRVASRWEDAKRDHVLVLRALARLTSRSDEEAKGFTQVEITEEIRAFHFDTWPGTEAPEDWRKRVTNAWKRLEEEWPKRITGITQRLTDEEIELVPALSKSPGGGRGKPSLYRLTFAQSQSEEHEHIKPPSPSWDGSIRYYLDELSEARMLRWLASDGLILSGWRAKAFAATLGLLLLAAGGLFILLLLALTQVTTVQALTNSLIAIGVIGTALWLLLRPLFRLVNERIAQAPMWLQGGSAFDERLLEIQRDDARQCNIIRLTRYTADCPICSAQVRIQPGHREFHHRLVGRCSRAPREHVFSFDHVMRAGKALRAR